MKRPDDLKVGDKFVVVGSHERIDAGEVISLIHDDGSTMPAFIFKCDCYWVDFEQLAPYTDQEEQQVDLSKYQPDPSRLENGKVYEFSNDGETWCLGVLGEKSRLGNYFSCHAGTFAVFKFVREAAAAVVGKIAPEPLVEGQAYVFDVGSDTGIFGVFNGGRLCASDLDDPAVSLIGYYLDRCTNIRKLVPEG